MMKLNQPITRQELANILHVHRNTLNRWLKSEGILLKARLIPPDEIRDILIKLGYENLLKHD